MNKPAGRRPRLGLLVLALTLHWFAQAADPPEPLGLLTTFTLEPPAHAQEYGLSGPVASLRANRYRLESGEDGPRTPLGWEWQPGTPELNSTELRFDTVGQLLSRSLSDDSGFVWQRQTEQSTQLSLQG